jgi:hypothetical protein
VQNAWWDRTRQCWFLIVGYDLLMILLLLTSLLTQTSAGALRFDAPDGWSSRQAASSMRVAEFTLPRGAGDTDDGELIVYFFGGSGGSVDANIDRWIAQMQQPDGSPSKAAAKRGERTVNGLKVTTVDVAGTYIAEVRPGSAERHNKPGYRMRAAVVITPKGPYFIKAVAPAKTMARWDAAIESFLRSLRFES